LCNRRRDLKKLIEAARHWAQSLSGGHKGEDQRVADLQAFGAPDDVVGNIKATQARHDEAFYILPENWDVILVWMQMQTQWRRAGATGLMTGLDYCVLDIVTKALSIDLDAVLLNKLQRMEFAAMEELAKT